LEKGIPGIADRSSTEIGEVPEEEISRAVNAYRRERRTLEITVVAESRRKPHPFPSGILL
jgi:hypothetical protein